MSTSEEIMEVYEGDINEKSLLVMKKFGPGAFYDNFRGMKVEKIHPQEFIDICGEIDRADNAPAHKRADKGSL